jgi:hypothetical protein
MYNQLNGDDGHGRCGLTGLIISAREVNDGVTSNVGDLVRLSSLDWRHHGGIVGG